MIHTHIFQHVFLQTKHIRSCSKEQRYDSSTGRKRRQTLPKYTGRYWCCGCSAISGIISQKYFSGNFYTPPFTYDTVLETACGSNWHYVLFLVNKLKRTDNKIQHRLRQCYSNWSKYLVKCSVLLVPVVLQPVIRRTLQYSNQTALPCCERLPVTVSWRFMHLRSVLLTAPCIKPKSRPKTIS